MERGRELEEGGELHTIDPEMGNPAGIDILQLLFPPPETIRAHTGPDPCSRRYAECLQSTAIIRLDMKAESN
jgi:hypothetical protein